MVVGLLLAQFPPATVESVLFTLVVYFISGVARSASCFFFFMLVVWSAANCLAGLYRLIAYLTPSMVVGSATGSLVLLFLTITNVGVALSMQCLTIEFLLVIVIYCVLNLFSIFENKKCFPKNQKAHFYA